jgi:type II secretory pathway pseudopilin PulG
LKVFFLLSKPYKYGFSLVEILVAMAILIFISTQFVGFIKDTENANAKLKALNGRQKIISLVQNQMNNIQAIQQSAKTSSPELWACVNPDATSAGCSYTSKSVVKENDQNVRKTFGFTLKDPTKISSESLVADGTNPVPYDVDGLKCDTPSAAKITDSNCIYEVLTTFRANCALAAASCVTPESVELFFRIRIRPSMKSKISPKYKTITEVSNSPAIPAGVAEVDAPTEQGRFISFRKINLSQLDPAIVVCKTSCGGRHKVVVGSWQSSGGSTEAYGASCSGSSTGAAASGTDLFLCSK